MSAQPLISLVMIVKNEEVALPACLESVKDIVDEYVIVDTGSTDGTAAVIAQYTEAVHSLPFEDFVTTKNKALALATGAYILFMDADERLLAGHDILKQSAQHGEGAIGARIVEGEWPTVNNAYYRLRLWRNTDEWRFTGPGVHEVIMGPDAVTWHADVIVQHDHSHRTPQSYEQRYALYVRLLNTALAHDSNDLRAWFYLARTEKDAGHHLAAIAAYDEYLRRNPTWRDEIWQTHFDSALCLQQLGEYAKAFTALAQAVETDSRRAEAYCQRGDIYMLLGEWQNAAVAYEMALAQTEPTDVLLFHNPNTYKRYPADQLVLAYDKLHWYADGLRTAHMVLDAYPKPQTRLVNNLTWLRSMAERRWLFALGATPEPVYGDLLAHSGAGGVETTYIELPKALAAQGQRVFVACNCYAEHESDGVTFLPYTMLNEYLRWYHPQVLVASRWHDALTQFSADQKILWLQDAWFAETPPAVWQSVRKVVVSSPWHRTYVAQRAGSDVVRKTQVIPLGIRKSQFADLGMVRQPHQLIYSSNPDRGLQTLVNAWPQIMAAVPDVNLIITYGWEGLLTWSGDPTWQVQQETMRDRLTAWAGAVGNVTFTGRLPKAELYRQMAASAVCAYPNNFWETFCLTALECQAAGTPLITSALGALPTTCNPLSNILLSGDPQSKVYQEHFAAEVSSLLLDDTRCQAMSAACLDYVAATPCDWSDIAQQWLDLIWSDGIGV